MSKQLLSDSLSLEEIEQQQDTDWELQSQIHEIQQLELQLEELQRAYVTVESIQQNLQSTTESATLEAYRFTLEHLFEDHKFAHADITQEGLGNVLSNIGNAISNVSREIADRVKDTFATVFKGMEDLENRRQKIAGAMENMENTEPRKKLMKVSGPQRLYYRGSVKGSDVAEGLESAGEALRGYQSGMVEFAQAFFSQFGDHQEQVTELDDDDETETATLAEEVEESQTSLLGQLTSAGENIQGTKLPGGKIIKLTETKRVSVKSSAKDNQLVMVPMIDDDPDEGQFEGSSDIDPPSIRDMETILEGAGRLIENLVNQQDELKAVLESGTAVKNRADEMDQIRRDVNLTNLNDIGLGGILLLNLFGNNAKRWARTINQAILDLLPYQYRTARSALVYLERGIKTYS